MWNPKVFYPSHGVELPTAGHPQRRQFERPRGGRSRRGGSFVPSRQAPRGSGFESFPPSGPRFPSRGDRSPMGHGGFGVFPNTFPGHMTQHWFSPYTNPSVMPYAHPMFPFY